MWRCPACTGLRLTRDSSYQVMVFLPCRTYGVVAFAALIVLSRTGAEQSDQTLSELLQRVATTYAGITDYVINATSTAVGGPTPVRDDGDVIAQQPSHGGGTFGPIVRTPVVDKIVVARSGGAFHYQLKAVLGAYPPSLWITDSHTTWHYSGASNKYTEEPAAPWPAAAGPGRNLPGMEWRYFARLRALGQMADRARLVKTNSPADSVCPGPSTTVELQIADGDDGAAEQLRILNETALVCQSIVRRRNYSGHGRVAYWTITTSWDYKQISGAIEPALFTFIAPSRAKRVTELR